MQPQDFSLMKVSEIMRHPVYTVDKDIRVCDAVQKMSALNVGAIVVADTDGRAIGIFTERDLMNRVVALGRDPAATALSAVMTANPKMLGPDTLVTDVFRFLQNAGMRHLIIGDEAVLAGIVSIRDINTLLVTVIENTLTQLSEAMRQLIEAEQMNALGEFTGGITHELNQPLNVTKIICQSLLRDIQKERFSAADAKNDLPEIVNQMNRMSEIVGHMAAFSRKSGTTIPQAFDINALMEDTLKCLQQQYKDHHIELVINLSPGLPLVAVDSLRIGRVYFHILSNAHYALVHSEKAEKKIQVRSYQASGGSEVVMEIADNGAGISDENKARLFQPFFTTKEPGKGTGMGLLVCKKIIEEHKGRIEFESKAGEGALFRVILPVKEN